ncbi:MAG: hypothetical protein JWN34_1802 [Bryobacterales bacterium]|nr:hypothetical protein [Bryobacterales bacterium]
MKSFLRVGDTIINMAQIQRVEVLAGDEVELHLLPDWTQTYSGLEGRELFGGPQRQYP